MEVLSNYLVMLLCLKTNKTDLCKSSDLEERLFVSKILLSYIYRFLKVHIILLSFWKTEMKGIYFVKNECILWTTCSHIEKRYATIAFRNSGHMVSPWINYLFKTDWGETKKLLISIQHHCQAAFCMLRCMLPFLILFSLLFRLHHIVLHDWEMKLERGKKKFGE